MANFKFKLENVLDMKVKNENESKAKYAKANMEKQVVEEKLNTLQEKYSQYSDISNIPIDNIVQQKIISNYLNTIAYSIESTTVELEEKEEIFFNSKMDFISKQMERKSIEKLKSKKLKEFNKKQDLLEQMQNDEFSIQSYLKKQQGIL